MPDASIIVPTYNSEKYAKQLCKSLLNQTFQNFEVIIVDNYSTDNTIEAIKKLVITTQNLDIFQLEMMVLLEDLEI